MSCPSLPVHIATRWIAAEVKRHLAKLPPRAVEHCGFRFTLNFKTSQYASSETTFNLRPLFTSTEASEDAQLVEFENDGVVTFISIPPKAVYPLVVDGGVAIDKDTVAIFKTGEPARILKRPVESAPVAEDYVVCDLYSSAKPSNKTPVSREEFPDYPEVREQVLKDIEEGLIPKEELVTVNSVGFFRSIPFWRNLQDLYTKYGKQVIYFHRTLFPEETDKDFNLVRIRAQMMKDIDNGVLPLSAAEAVISKNLFYSTPYYKCVLEIYKRVGVTPIVVLHLINNPISNKIVG